MKAIGITIVTAGLALALSACGGSGNAKPTEAPRQPVLSVPQTTTGGSATLTVKAGDLAKGTAVSVYAFPLGWDEGKTDCTDPEAVKKDLTISNPGTEQRVTVQVDSGVTAFVLAGPEFTTPCNAPKSSTVQKNLVTASVSTPKKAVEPGKEAGLSVSVQDLYSDEGGEPMDGAVQALGPWATVPEASAAPCKDAPVAKKATVGIKPIDKQNLKAVFPFKMKLKEPGVYRLVASLPETERTTAFDSCETGAENLVIIK